MYIEEATRAVKGPQDKSAKSQPIRALLLRSAFSIPHANVLPTGSATSCVSDVGAFDMVGNLWEWVADWIQGDSNPFAPQTNGTTNATYGNDLMSGTNPAQTQGDGHNFPAAVERGGSFGYGNGTAAGVFALSAAQAPSAVFSDLGFRCGR